jgi:CheY-like chemotaxis protein
VQRETTTLLVIEDNPGDARLVQEALDPERNLPYDVRVCGNLADGLAQLDTASVDVIVLDLNLPDSSGLDTFRRTREKVPNIPIVVLSGIDDEELALEAVRGGAQDYLVKGQILGPGLRRTIRHAMERQRLLAGLDERIQSLIRGDPQLAELVLHNPDGVLVVGADRKIAYANPTAARQFGATADQLAGRELGVEVIPGERQSISVRDPAGRHHTLEARSAQAVWSDEQVHVLTLREADIKGPSLLSRLWSVVRQ